MRKSARAGKMKWCHVVWPTYRRRQLFKIPAAARFCERVIRHGCTARGWLADVVCLAPDQVHVLVLSPTGLSRRAVVRALQRVAAGAVRRAGLAGRWERRLWNGWAWCGILSSAPSVRAVRSWLIARRATCLGVGLWDEPLITLHAEPGAGSAERFAAWRADAECVGSREA
jgi:REP element-mobilizing transposase RayT